MLVRVRHQRAPVTRIRRSNVMCSRCTQRAVLQLIDGDHSCGRCRPSATRRCRLQHHTDPRDPAQCVGSARIAAERGSTASSRSGSLRPTTGVPHALHRLGEQRRAVPSARRHVVRRRNRPDRSDDDRRCNSELVHERGVYYVSKTNALRVSASDAVSRLALHVDTPSQTHVRALAPARTHSAVDSREQRTVWSRSRRVTPAPQRRLYRSSCSTPRAVSRRHSHPAVRHCVDDDSRTPTRALLSRLSARSAAIPALPRRHVLLLRHTRRLSHHNSTSTTSLPPPLQLPSLPHNPILPPTPTTPHPPPPPLHRVRAYRRLRFIEEAPGDPGPLLILLRSGLPRPRRAAPTPLHAAAAPAAPRAHAARGRARRHGSTCTPHAHPRGERARSRRGSSRS